MPRKLPGALPALDADETASLEGAGAALGNHVERAPLHILRGQANAAGVAHRNAHVRRRMGGFKPGETTSTHIHDDAVKHGADYSPAQRAAIEQGRAILASRRSRTTGR